MSASKDKLNRKQQIEAGTDKRTAAQAKEKAQQRKSAITYTIVAVVLVIFFAFIFIYNSNWPSRHLTAVTIDGKDYSVAQANYYYSAAYMSFYNSYADYMNYGLFFDPNESLDDQEYSEGMSWRDYFRDAAVQNMAQIQMFCDEAEAAGFTLSEEDQAAYDEQMEALSTNWSSLGYESLQQFINLNYGKGVTEDMIRQETYRGMLAAAYAESIGESFEYAPAQLDAHYADVADQYDVIDYAVYSIAAPAEEEASDETADETADETEPADEAEPTEEPEEAETPAEPAVDADAVLEAIDGTDEETFAAYVSENFDGAEITSTTLPGSSLSADYSQFLLDSAREAGDADVTVAEDGTTYIVMFLGRDKNDYKMASFRHILINAEDADGDGTYSDEEIQAAADEAQSVYEEWQAGDATEDSFAELANERSDDGGSNTTGGLYENVYKNQMVPPINDWLFEDGRKAGDTTVVSYDGQAEGGYTGTHVVYFAGFSDLTYAQYIADSEMRSDDYASWSEEHMVGYDPSTSHMDMVGKNH